MHSVMGAALLCFQFNMAPATLICDMTFNLYGVTIIVESPVKMEDEMILMWPLLLLNWKINAGEQD